MESFVNTIRSLYQQQQQQQQHQSAQGQPQSSTQKPINYNEIYNTINSNLELFNENSDNLFDNVLPIFTLPEFTLPTMAALYAITSKAQSQVKSLNEIEAVANLGSVNEDKLLNHLENCLKNSDPRQIEVACDVYTDLCHFYTNKLIQLNRAKRGLLIVNESICKLQFDAGTEKLNFNQLTTVHADLLKLSLASKNFSLALKLMSNEILDIKKSQSSSFDSKHYLSYFYYSGCVATSLKQFDDALFYFEQVLNVPASALSQIMIDAYKKYILLSLISRGKIQSLPKYTSRIVVNQIKPICSVYHELASAFVAYEQDKLNNLCYKYQDVFERDKNAGLIKQLQNAFYKINIQKLTKTFITLSLSDMVAKAKLPNAKHAENLILNMIRDGEVFATINQKDGMVSFHDNPEKYDNPVLMNQLTNQIFKCIELDENIKRMDNEITTHPHYIQKCQASISTGVDEIDQLLQ